MGSESVLSCILRRIVFTYGKLIYNFYGEKAENAFVRTWGVALGMGAAPLQPPPLLVPDLSWSVYYTTLRAVDVLVSSFVMAIDETVSNVRKKA